MIRFTIPEKIDEKEIELNNISSYTLIKFANFKSVSRIPEVFNILDSLPKEYNFGLFKIDSWESTCLMSRKERIQKDFSITSRFYRKLINELYLMQPIKINHNSNIFIIKEIFKNVLVFDDLFKNPDEFTSDSPKLLALGGKIVNCLNLNINNNKPLKGEYYFVFIDELIWYLSEKFKDSFIGENCLLSNKDILSNKNQDEFNDFILHLYTNRDIEQFLKNWMSLYKDLGKDIIEVFLNRIKVPFKGFCFEKEDNLMDLKIKVQ